jgi:hypothetical protein
MHQITRSPRFSDQSGYYDNSSNYALDGKLVGHDTSPNLDDLVSLDYSECGQFYTIRLRGQQRPSVFPVQKTHREDTGPSTAQALDLARPQARKRKFSAETPDSEAVLTMTATRSLPTSSGMVSIEQDGSQTISTIMAPRQGPSRIELHRIYQGETEEDHGKTAIHLVSVPSHVDQHGLRTVVKWPSNQEERIKIILSQLSRSYYESDKKPGAQATYVVHRDPRSLSIVSQSNTIANQATSTNSTAAGDPIKLLISSPLDTSGVRIGFQTT